MSEKYVYYLNRVKHFLNDAIREVPRVAEKNAFDEGYEQGKLEVCRQIVTEAIERNR